MFTERAPFSFEVKVLSNLSPDSDNLVEYSVPEGTKQLVSLPTEYEWPTGIYSLSHIAVPFAPSDPFYGTDGQALSSLHVLGERRVLFVPPAYFQRLRYNPWFDYQTDTIKSWLSEQLSSGTPRAEVN